VNNKEYSVGNFVVMKKGHPCGENKWEIIKLGADIRIKCAKCGRMVIIPRIDFNKKIKRVLEKEE
jgi:hypothetical protein